MIKKMSNAQIFALSNKLESVLSAENKRYMPAKISYFINKNRAKLVDQMSLIEKSRVDIIQHYGALDSDNGSYNVPSDKLDQANKELMELLSIDQELDISMVNISDLDGLDFTLEQMEVLSFMIEE